MSVVFNLLGIITFQTPQKPFPAFRTGHIAEVNLLGPFLEHYTAAEASAVFLFLVSLSSLTP